MLERWTRGGVRARHEITRGRLVADERHLPEQLKSEPLLSFIQTMTTALGRPAVLNAVIDTMRRLVADERHLAEQLNSNQLLSFTQTSGRRRNDKGVTKRVH